MSPTLILIGAHPSCTKAGATPSSCAATSAAESFDEPKVIEQSVDVTTLLPAATAPNWVPFGPQADMSSVVALNTVVVTVVADEAPCAFGNIAA